MCLCAAAFSLLMFSLTLFPYHLYDGLTLSALFFSYWEQGDCHSWWSLLARGRAARSDQRRSWSKERYWQECVRDEQTEWDSTKNSVHNREQTERRGRERYKKKTNTKETIRQRSADIIYTYTEADERHRDRVTDLSLFSEPPTKSKTRSDDIFTDILWSDPRPITGREKSDRGAGVHFGLDVTRK